MDQNQRSNPSSSTKKTWTRPEIAVIDLKTAKSGGSGLTDHGSAHS